MVKSRSNEEERLTCKLKEGSLQFHYRRRILVAGGRKVPRLSPLVAAIGGDYWQAVKSTTDSFSRFQEACAHRPPSVVSFGSSGSFPLQKFQASSSRSNGLLDLVLLAGISLHTLFLFRFFLDPCVCLVVLGATNSL